VAIVDRWVATLSFAAIMINFWVVIYAKCLGILMMLLDRYCRHQCSNIISNYFTFIEESSLVTIQPPKSNSQGYTLLEMLAVLGMAGIVIGMTTSSFLSVNKPLRIGTSQFVSQLSLIRSKAISSNQAYRIRPKYSTASEYNGNPRSFIVEYAANCRVNTYGFGLSNINPSTDPNRPYNPLFSNGTPDGWQQASEFDLDLPKEVGIIDPAAVLSNTITPVSSIMVESVPISDIRENGTSTTGGGESFQSANRSIVTSDTFDANLNWSICYDNRGMVYQPVRLTLQDFQGNNKAGFSVIEITGVGQLRLVTIDRQNGSIIPVNGSTNPVSAVSSLEY
jgi:type II secretory pathway pseudopilin PulG